MAPSAGSRVSVAKSCYRLRLIINWLPLVATRWSLLIRKAMAACASPQKNHRIRGAYLLDSVTEGIGHLWLQLLSARQMVPLSLPLAQLLHLMQLPAQPFNLG